MSLPWFPFNIKDFLANTKRLNTEAKGAYLLLMLDYYEQEKGPPDDDDVLAAICELSPEAWARHRKVLAPLFNIEDGIWTHNRIRDELRNGQRRYDQTVAATAAAKAAREAKKTGTSTQRAPERSTSRTPRRLTVIDTSSVTTTVTDSVQDNVTALQEQEQPLITGGEEGAPPKAASQGMGTQVDPEFQPAEHVLAHYADWPVAEMAAETRKFIAYHQARESLSSNWQASFVTWLEREIAHRAKIAKPAKAAPRIEVNSAPDWDAYAARFAKGMGWPKGVGPDPDSAACRCPPDILAKHNIGPKAKVQA